MLPWFIKHAPIKSSEIVGQLAGLAALRAFLKKRGRLALLAGPPGCGKSVSLAVLAAELDFELCEFDSAQLEDEAELDALKKCCQQASLFGRPKVLAIDWFEDSSQELATKLIQSTASAGCSVILTTNDAWLLRAIRARAKLITFSKLTTPEIIALLERIARAEGLILGRSKLTAIAASVGGDARAAINELQATLGSFEPERRSWRRTELTVLASLFAAPSLEAALAALKELELEPAEKLELVAYYLGHACREPDRLATCFDQLSKADLCAGRISRRQEWHMLSHHDALLCCAVRTARAQQMIFLPRKKRWPSGASPEIRALASALHCSTRKAISVSKLLAKLK